jgi:hypothetical protein
VEEYRAVGPAFFAKVGTYANGLDPVNFYQTMVLPQLLLYMDFSFTEAALLDNPQSMSQLQRNKVIKFIKDFDYSTLESSDVQRRKYFYSLSYYYNNYTINFMSRYLATLDQPGTLNPLDFANLTEDARWRLVLKMFEAIGKRSSDVPAPADITQNFYFENFVELQEVLRYTAFRELNEYVGESFRSVEAFFDYDQISDATRVKVLQFLDTQDIDLQTLFENQRVRDTDLVSWGLNPYSGSYSPTVEAIRGFNET